MPIQLSQYQLPLFSAAALALLLLFYLIPKSQLRGAQAMAGVIFDSLLLMIGAAFETMVNDLNGKIFWHQVTETGTIWLPLAWLLFNVEFLQKRGWRRKRNLVLACAIPGIATLALWTNAIHLGYWGALALPSEGVYQHLTFHYHLIELISNTYTDLLGIASILLLTRFLITARGVMFKQGAILLICSITPWISRVLPLMLPATYQSLNGPLFFFSLDTPLFLYGLFRYRLMNIIPISYQTMIAGMHDCILVISPDNYIVQLNPAAEELLGQPARTIINKPVEKALAQFPALLEHCCSKGSKTVEEINLPLQGIPGYYEMRLIQLNEPGGYFNGRLVILRNVTQRVLAEHASRQSQQMLKKSEEKYRALVENISEVIYTADLEGIITYASPAIERMLGISPQAVIGKSFRDFIYFEDRSMLENNLPYLLNGQIYTLEFRAVDQHGEIRFLRTSSRLVTQEDLPPALHGVATDITEQRMVEDALERRASQLAMLNYIGEQITAAIELDSVLDSATQLIQRHFGYYHVAIMLPNPERDELLLRSTSGAFTEVLSENHRLRYNQGMVGWVAQNKSILLANDVRMEPRYTNLYPDKILTRSELTVPILIGEELAGVLDIQSPLIDAFDDNDVRVIKTVADQIATAMENARLYEEVRCQLKERENKENMLRIQRDLLVSLSLAHNLEEMLKTAVTSLAIELHASQVAISLVNWNDNTVQPLVSQGYAEHTIDQSIPIEGSLGGWVARSQEPIRVADAIAEDFQTQVPPGIRSLLCVPLILNGSAIGIINLESCEANAFSEDELRLLSTISSSLVILIEQARLFEEVEKARAELEKRATELEKANASLRELDRLKSQFLANMSHELRTPLNSIIGFSEVLVDGLNGTLNDDQKEFIQDIQDSGKHLLNLITDLLDFSKIEAGHMLLDPVAFDVLGLFDELRGSIAPLTEKKSQQLLFQAEPELPLVRADRLRLKQVFINLLGNANKFTPPGGCITTACRCYDPDHLLFSVTDTGIGIRAEDQALIFEEFRQVDGSMTREVPGTGLGLAISKRIIELHHGQIWVESSVGKGATFYVKLPIDTLPVGQFPVSALNGAAQ